MKTSLTATLTALLLTVSSGLGAEDAPKPLYPQYPSETPTNFTPVSDTWDYNPSGRHDPHARWREAPHHHPGAQGRIARRHLLTRTPYEAKTLTATRTAGTWAPCCRATTTHTDVILEDGYIRVVQDVLR